MANNIAKTPPKGKVKFDINLSDEQKEIKSNIIEHPYNFVLGRAGSGKTLLAVQIALDAFFTRKVNKIIIARPTISNEENGFIPGPIEDKLEPWLVPIRSNMRKVYNKPAILEKLESDNSIELVPLTHFRGRTFENAVIIVDEFQNLTKAQLGMALGRLGKESTMILTGDKKQIDLKCTRESAVHHIDKLNNSNFVYSAELTENHRHPALEEVVRLLYEFD